MSKLVIVESPAKAKTIEKYLGDEYQVLPTIGHIRELPKKNAIDTDNNYSMRTKSGKGLTGASAAAPIWVHFMQKALEGKTMVNFPVQENIKFETVDVETGRLPEEFSLEKMEVAVKDDIDLSPIPILNEELENITEVSKEPEAIIDSSRSDDKSIAEFHVAT